MSFDTLNPLPPLTGAQIAAVEPDHSIWLSASAGSGKTQVLSARVIRLLLEPAVRPEHLLCLTFTKAAAAEMADRINHRLAYWVQAKASHLAADLKAMNADYSPEGQARARKLFAQVLDAPGGGLQIMTIHSFCQSLLSAFPEEAGLLPGFEPIDDRAVAQLHSDTLAELVQAADTDGRSAVIQNLQDLSLLLGEEDMRHYLRRCVAQGDTLEQMVTDSQGALQLAQRIMGLEFEGTAAEEMARRCDDSVIDRNLLSNLAEMNRDWSKGKIGSRGNNRALEIEGWLARNPTERATDFQMVYKCFMKSDGDIFVHSKGYTPLDENYKQLATEASVWVSGLQAFQNEASYAERLSAALLTGKLYAAQYRELKHARGLVDFDDMIVHAAKLLNSSGMAEWVRFKLDRRIDHILIDEAQDTNAAQWDIIEALSDDFFSGEGAGPDRARTIFAVGDFKQAIYGFQGTAPEKYRDAGQKLEDRIAQTGEQLRTLSLSRSFRSTRPILRFVNAVLDELGYQQLGLGEPIPDHGSEKPDFGSVELMRCTSAAVDTDESDGGDEDSDDAEEAWITTEKLQLAKNIAQHVKNMLDAKPVLATTGLPLQPGDIMILLRSRGELAGLIVARLQALRVPVAGIDRLKIVEPLVVQDLLATIRFALQPQDDLSLACLLVSPLIGWDQDRLLRHGYRPNGVSLWQHLRAQADIASDLEPLRAMLASADLATPYAFLEGILSGPIAGRQKLQARLGSEILVPVDELLNLAIQYQQEGGASLQGFLDWFEKGGGEIKREGLSQSPDVRVMTVHGAKGLEAPVVILADIAVDPEQKPDWKRGIDFPLADDRSLPLFPVRKVERGERLQGIAEAQKEREIQEHFRLLYVAMTRAAEHLVLAGCLNKKSKGVIAEKSWFAALEAGLIRLGCEWSPDPLWGAAMRYETSGSFERKRKPQTETEAAIATPVWLGEAAPEESRPPRPLAPSNLDDDLFGDAPASAALKSAAMRGKWLHALFEQADFSQSESFEKAALAWLERQNPDRDFDHAQAVAEVCSVLENPSWAPLFSKAARAEVPLAAVVGTTVITGRVDRLLIEADRVRLVDFKTGKTIPRSQTDVALPVLRQMAHYVAALEKIFAPRPVEASLLYTAGPRMLTLTADILEPHKPQ